MTTPEQPPNDRTVVHPVQPVQPVGAPVGAEPQPVEVRTVRRGPGWGAYVVTVIALLLLIAVIVFVLQNDDRLTIKFFSWTKHNVKSSLALGAAALVGFIAGIFLGLIPWLSARRQIRSLRRNVQ